MKKLKAQQETEQDNFNVHFHEALVATPDILDINVPFVLPQSKADYAIYNSNLYPQEFSAIVFQPPIFA